RRPLLRPDRRGLRHQPWNRRGHPGTGTRRAAGSPAAERRGDAMTRTDDPLRERLHRAALWDDDRDWRDVRRRARRQRAPAVLAAALVLVVVVAAPAFAFRHQIADWRRSASPESTHFVDAFVECGRGTFTLTFDS